MAERINESIRAGEFGVSLDETPYLCECPDPRCHAVVWLAPEEFDDLRNAGRAVIKSGPDLPETAAPAVVIALAGRLGDRVDRKLAIRT